jgi:hypothetical protein
VIEETRAVSAFSSKPVNFDPLRDVDNSEQVVAVICGQRRTDSSTLLVQVGA